MKTVHMLMLTALIAGVAQAATQDRIEYKTNRILRNMKTPEERGAGDTTRKAAPAKQQTTRPATRPGMRPAVK